ncbi:lysoplasmalogenase [Legionella spiritensis]|uniref:lysoplasmalogenase n=1 Tax=Legionella spiritensis TaxID=452 RepID=UPI000F7018E9|nr:lysoplasmalogenase [Legionella spiritensis]VEG91706.1 transmembrane protein [Legionella spiritensis]
MADNLPRASVTLFFISMLAYLILLPFISYPVTTLLKPLPIVCLLGLTWTAMQPSVSLKRRLTAAIISSLVGDLALTLPVSPALPVGMACFILAHCAYISLFLQDFSFKSRRLVYFIIMLAILGSGYTYLWSAMGDLAVPALIYGIVLSAMVFTALQVEQQAGLIITGACLFFISDGILGINLFLMPHSNALALAVMTTYYSAQFLLVTGLLLRNNHPKPQWEP